LPELPARVRHLNHGTAHGQNTHAHATRHQDPESTKVTLHEVLPRGWAARAPASSPYGTAVVTDLPYVRSATPHSAIRNQARAQRAPTRT
jgi:hypothetical protein